MVSVDYGDSESSNKRRKNAQGADPVHIYAIGRREMLLHKAKVVEWQPTPLLDAFPLSWLLHPRSIYIALSSRMWGAINSAGEWKQSVVKSPPLNPTAHFPIIFVLDEHKESASGFPGQRITSGAFAIH